MWFRLCRESTPTIFRFGWKIPIKLALSIELSDWTEMNEDIMLMIDANEFIRNTKIRRFC